MSDQWLHFWSHVLTGNGCWYWVGRRQNRNGRTDGQYGILARSRKTFLAHRWVWQLVYGPIPEGLCVLHVCDNRLCVRPSHLKLGSVADNQADMARKKRGSNQWKDKPTCARGHLFTDANTYLTKNRTRYQRQCKTCNALRARLRRVK